MPSAGRAPLGRTFEPTATGFAGTRLAGRAYRTARTVQVGFPRALRKRGVALPMPTESEVREGGMAFPPFGRHWANRTRMSWATAWKTPSSSAAEGAK
jgi:hypothetical protein